MNRNVSEMDAIRALDISRGCEGRAVRPARFNCSWGAYWQLRTNGCVFRDSSVFLPCTGEICILIRHSR